MSIEYKVIGRHIRAARTQKKMTQEAVADAIEMSYANFGKIERGDRPVNLPRLAQLSILLDKPIESLVEGSVVRPAGAEFSETHADNPLVNFTRIMESIAKGCSEDALQLMIKLCEDVAQADKTR